MKFLQRVTHQVFGHPYSRFIEAGFSKDYTVFLCPCSAYILVPARSARSRWEAWHRREEANSGNTTLSLFRV